ncbi:anti-sigma B factor antagonist [Allocatelliglobosispora scoriae]|uniref:Anti-sigma factor antagonist n=1 Tax=Allocatelliglobosispora scoriae TaxID=643052 RepID=A0A841BKA4_9ACTN|nr:STAS domain-containing protein [Allocatelliglobosispora scoriae]MBB5867656.1 anti-sigma B factor antagonist [Allocatelliglobosispora scoriae]
MSLVVNVELRDEIAIVEVEGELDIATVPQVDAALTAALADNRPAVVFDFTKLSFCDSTGLRLLVRAHQELEARSGAMAIGGATAIVAQVLEVSGLAEIFGCVPTVEAAVAAVSAPR